MQLTRKSFKLNNLRRSLIRNFWKLSKKKSDWTKVRWRIHWIESKKPLLRSRWNRLHILSLRSSRRKRRRWIKLWWTNFIDKSILKKEWKQVNSKPLSQNTAKSINGTRVTLERWLMSTPLLSWKHQLRTLEDSPTSSRWSINQHRRWLIKLSSQKEPQNPPTIIFRKF